MTPSARRALRGLLAALVAATLLLIGIPAASAGSARPGEERLTVMTRNLYLGADLLPLVSASTPGQLQAAVAGILTQVVRSAPPQRMAEVAAEVDATRPDVVSLQEVARWTIQTPSGTLRFDFLDELLGALTARGLHYRVAVAQDNVDTATALPALSTYGTFLDRDVLLVRSDRADGLRVLRTRAAHYTSQLRIPVPLLGTTIDFMRGYVWADLLRDGHVVRVVDTHPEAYTGFGGVTHDFTADQASELLAALGPWPLPTIVAGDLNSAPGETARQAYAVLTAAGFEEVGELDADTCCFDGDLAAGTLTERIDHVLVRGPVEPVDAELVGAKPVASTPPLWPSDHAGLVATVELERGHPGPR